MKTCLDCAYQGNYFPQGVCPGCGSKNITSALSNKNKDEPPPKPFRLIFCIAIWVYLIFEISHRFV